RCFGRSGRRRRSFPSTPSSTARPTSTLASDSPSMSTCRSSHAIRVRSRNRSRRRRSSARGGRTRSATSKTPSTGSSGASTPRSARSRRSRRGWCRRRPTSSRSRRKRIARAGRPCSACSKRSAACAISGATGCRQRSICSCRLRSWRNSLAPRFADMATPRKYDTTKPHVALAFVLAAVVASVACGGKHADDETKAPDVPPITAETTKVARRAITEDLVVRGTVAAVPNEDVKVSALVAGRVNAVSVAEGDTVKEGQVIAELDRQPLEDQRRQAAAGGEQAKAQLENARLNLQRNEQLFERGIAAGKEVEDARAQLAAAQSALETANAQLSIAQRNVERAAVRSPIAGQVVKRMVSVGEQVDGTGAQPI